MDAFEQIIGQLLEEEKYWIRHSVKIELTKNEKRDIGTPCTPRPEIDIVALDQSSNALYLLEVKSFLDSSGVVFEQVTENQEQQKGRYKLLTSENYRKVISARLLEDWIKIGTITKDTKVNFGLIAGKVHNDKKNPNRETDLRNYFLTPIPQFIKRTLFLMKRAMKESRPDSRLGTLMIVMILKNWT